MSSAAEVSALYTRLAGAASAADLSAALGRLGDHHRERGELEPAAAAYEAALALAPTGAASLGRGLVALMRGESFAEAYFAQATRLLAEAGDVAGAATAEGNHAATALAAGRVTEALSGLRGALSRLEEAGLPPDPLLLCNPGRPPRRAGDEARPL